jgi:phosphopantetheinyl transferase (holo-ACP synthase)
MTPDELTKKLEHLREVNSLSHTQTQISIALLEACHAAKHADREAFQKAWETATHKSADFLDQAHALMARIENDADAENAPQP